MLGFFKKKTRKAVIEVKKWRTVMRLKPPCGVGT